MKATLKIIDQIGDDKNKGEEIIAGLACIMFDWDKEIIALEEKLCQAKALKKYCREQIDTTLKQIGINTPCTVKLKEGVVRISENNITLVQNFL